jgi:hypothetical protein
MCFYRIPPLRQQVCNIPRIFREPPVLTVFAANCANFINNLYWRTLLEILSRQTAAEFSGRPNGSTGPRGDLQ